MENSNISWTDHTWNPWVGCRYVSTECDHCYADTMVTNRMGKDFGKVWRTQTWKDPVKLNRRAPELAKVLGHQRDRSEDRWLEPERLVSSGRRWRRPHHLRTHVLRVAYRARWTEGSVRHRGHHFGIDWQESAVRETK